jgi:predicted transcriptional regulator
MGTTTIRVDTETHARLVEMSRQTDRSLIDTVRDAAEALQRQQFAMGVARELDQLRSDPEAWKAYLGEADSTLVGDGVG